MGTLVVAALVVVEVVALVVTGGGLVVITTTTLRVDTAMVGFVVALVVKVTADFIVGFVVTLDLTVTAPDLTAIACLVVAAGFGVVFTCLDLLDKGISAFACSELGSKTARQLTDD